MAGSEHHQMSSRPGFCLAAGLESAGEPVPHAAFFQRPLLRRLSIMLTVKEKCLKEYHLLSQNTYGRELSISELITDMLGLFKHLSFHQISSKYFSNKIPEEMHMWYKSSNK